MKAFAIYFGVFLAGLILALIVLPSGMVTYSAWAGVIAVIGFAIYLRSRPRPVEAIVQPSSKEAKQNLESDAPISLDPASLTPAQLIRLSPEQIRVVAVREAIQSLGLIKPDAEHVITNILEMMVGGDRANTTVRRKEEPQLTREEKKALGLRSNAFMSVAALGDLTEAGKAIPLYAHENTALRAFFTTCRHRDVNQMVSQKWGKAWSGKFKYDVISEGCKVCEKLSGKLVPVDKLHILPPPRCTCPTANYGLQADIDFNKI